jgi:hypothetical protein
MHTCDTRAGGTCFNEQTTPAPTSEHKNTLKQCQGVNAEAYCCVTGGGGGWGWLPLFPNEHTWNPGFRGFLYAIALIWCVCVSVCLCVFVSVFGVCLCRWLALQQKSRVVCAPHARTHTHAHTHVRCRARRSVRWCSVFGIWYSVLVMHADAIRDRHVSIYLGRDRQVACIDTCLSIAHTCTDT